MLWKKSEPPSGNRTHDFPDTGRTHQPLIDQPIKINLIEIFLKNPHNAWKPKGTNKSVLIVAICVGLEEKKKEKRMQNYLSQTTRHTLHVEAIKLKGNKDVQITELDTTFESVNEKRLVFLIPFS